MRIDPEDLRRHYAALSDGEILDLDRSDLVEIAKEIYDDEIARRGLDRPQVEDSLVEPTDVEAAADLVNPDLDGPPADWLEEAACAYSTVTRQSVDYVSSVADVRAVLWAAGIPSYVTVKPE